MQWDRHCVGSNLMPYWAAIRAWVDPADFVPVLAEEVVVEFDDGSGVHLLLGTPLVGDRAWLDGQLVPVPGDAARATTYTGDAARLDDRSISAYFPWGIAGTIGGEPFTARQPDFQYGDEFYVTSFTAGGDGGGDGGGGGGLITLDHRCGEVRFRVGADVGPGEDAALAALFGSMAEGDWVSFPAGTRLYWIDGTAAGVVTQDQGVEAHRVHGELMRCVDEPIVNSLRGMTATVVPLCARPGDVVEPAAKAPATAPEATP
jgi:hypothetical protein